MHNQHSLHAKGISDNHQVVGCPPIVSLSVLQCGQDCFFVPLSGKVILMCRFLPGLMMKFQGCCRRLNRRFDSKSWRKNSPFLILAAPLSLNRSSKALYVLFSTIAINSYLGLVGAIKMGLQARFLPPGK